MEQHSEELLNKRNFLNAIENNAVYEDQLFTNITTEEDFKVLDTEFINCTFKNCKFFKISFFDCIFERCKFETCDLASSSITYTSFSNVNFIDTKLSGIQWAEAGIPLDVNFNRCILNYSSFIDVDLKNTEIIECQLREVDFSEANLSKSNCSSSDFTGARFINTNLAYANFTNATNYAIHPHGNKLCKTKFSLPEVLTLLDVFDIIIE